jgi:hypothetical protein
MTSKSLPLLGRKKPPSSATAGKKSQSSQSKTQVLEPGGIARKKSQSFPRARVLEQGGQETQ